VGGNAHLAGGCFDHGARQKRDVSRHPAATKVNSSKKNLIKQRIKQAQRT